jgi:hypothetical protein
MPKSPPWVLGTYGRGSGCLIAGCWMVRQSAGLTGFFPGAQNSSPGLCASVGEARWGVSGNRRGFGIGRDMTFCDQSALVARTWREVRCPSSVVSCNGPRNAWPELRRVVDEFEHRYTICSQGSRMDWKCNERFSASGEVEARGRPEVTNDRNR